MRRILCVEDDPDARGLLEFVLTDAGYEVVCAERSEQVLALTRNETFDLYILDNWLPDLSGEELCRTIRTYDPTTPILFHSGAAFNSDKERALSVGAQGYLVKPASPDKILSEVARLLGQ